MITRRGFAALCARGMLAIALGISSMAGSCASVFADILNYVGVGLKAFSVIVAMIGPAAAAVAPWIALINAGFADLQATVTEYDSAPAANKATLLGKIRTIIQALIDNFSAFLAQVPLGGTLEATIFGLVQLIVSTLGGYLAQLPGVAARRIMLRSRNNAAQTVQPAKRSIAEFRKEFNAQVVAGGYPSYQI